MDDTYTEKCAVSHFGYLPKSDEEVPFFIVFFCCLWRILASATVLPILVSALANQTLLFSENNRIFFLRCG